MLSSVATGGGGNDGSPADWEEEKNSKTANIFRESEKKEAHTMQREMEEDTIRGGDENSLGSVDQSKDGNGPRYGYLIH